jgi:hypothetical protein
MKGLVTTRARAVGVLKTTRAGRTRFALAAAAVHVGLAAVQRAVGALGLDAALLRATSAGAIRVHEAVHTAGAGRAGAATIHARLVSIIEAVVAPGRLTGPVAAHPG